MENKTSPLNKMGRFMDIIIKNWFLSFLVVSFTIAVISMVIQSLLPEQIPDQNNAWNEITPGYSNYNQVVQKLGQPLNTTRTENGAQSEFQSEFKALPHQVTTNESGVVTFIKEYVAYDPNHNLKQYTDQFGPADLVLIDDESGNAVKAHIFLEEGLVVLAHIDAGGVEQKWYFEPTTAENFLNSWGQNLSEEGEGPERPNY